MPRVVHFEIQADDPERAVKFYETVFDWKTTRWSGPQSYWLMATGPESEPGINGAIMNRNDPKSTVYNIVDVPSVDEYVRKVEAAGGTIILPKTAVPGVGYAAYFTDSEGNVMGLIENDPNVK
jgi:predicted enzyme related to lactoylglutathione lyase